MGSPRGGALLVALCLSAGSILAANPLALHKHYEVDAGSSVVVSLQGYDYDGDSMTVTITSLPDSGTLYQLSDVYSRYGYDPVAGVAITSVGTVVTGSQSRVVYVRPTSDVDAYGKFASFTYTVNDGTTTSQAGTVWLLPQSKKVEGSDFARTNDAWTITGQTSPQSATHEATSRGLVNRFIYGTDNLIHKGSTCDTQRWMFEAPAKFLGQQGVAYGGSLEFTLSSFSGDFTAGNLISGLNLVEIECSTCALNTGVTLAFPLSATTGFDGTTKAFSIPLTHTGGWLKDPKNTLTTWAAPTKCELLEVLAGITSLRIAGDFTCWYESVALDSVYFQAPASQIPICAQPTPDLSSCTCA